MYSSKILRPDSNCSFSLILKSQVKACYDAKNLGEEMFMRHHNPSNISFSYIFIAKLYSPLVASNDVESLLLKRKQFKPADWFLCFSTPK